MDFINSITILIAAIAILPALMPGVVYPYWWFSAVVFYEPGFPSLTLVDQTAILIAGAASVLAIVRLGYFFVPFLIAAIAYAFMNSPGTAHLSGFFLLVYVGSSFLSLLAVSLRFSPRSMVFFGSLTLLAAGLWLNSVAASLIIGKLLEFTINYLVFRVVSHALRQNAGQLRKLERIKYPAIFAKTLLLWLPVLAFASLGIWINHLMVQYVQNQAYAENIVIARPAAEGVPAARNLYWDLKYTMDLRFQQMDDAVDRLRAEALANAATLPETLPAIAVREFDASTPQPPLISESPYPCPSSGVKGILLGPPCRMIVRAINQSYAEYRNDKREQLRVEMTRVAVDVTQTAEARIETATKRYMEVTSRFESQSKLLLLYGFNGYLLFSYALNIVFFFVLVKSLLLVLARVAYSGDQKAVFTISPEVTDRRRSSSLGVANLRGAGRALTLRKGRKEAFYLVNNHKWNKTSGDLKLPPKQPLSAYFARVANKAYLLNRLDLTTVKSSPTLSVNEPERIVALQLRANQTVIFQFRDFAGMSENVTLQSNFNPNIALFCLGRRFFYISATGPGTLLLIAHGGISTGAKAKRVPVAAERLLVFDATERFKLDSQLTYPNVYLNSAYVSPQFGLVVTDTRDIPQPGLFGRVWRLITFLLLPW